jgi:hypothetical protein
VEDSTEIKAGLNVNIVVHVDIDKEITDVRSAIIYDVAGANIILSQTDPPFERHHIGRNVTVTHLIRRGNDFSRIGFSGKVINILNDYRHTSSSMVTAVIVKKETKINEYDLRMHFRVRPKADSNVTLIVGTEKCNLIDVTLGGARFSHKKDESMKSGNIINILLVIDDDKFNIEAKTIRVWSSSETALQENMEYVSVQFLSIDKNARQLLGRKIMMMQRKNVSYLK